MPAPGLAEYSDTTRLHPGKTEVRIYDYVDRAVPMLARMFDKRLRGYRAIGYAQSAAAIGYEEAKDDVDLVNGDEALLASDSPA
jgi:hypothetical protein